MFFADLHIHSRFSQGTSKYLTLQELHNSALKKGLHLLGTGDCTHPLWLEELSSELKYDENTGFYLSKNQESTLSYILQGEISCVYKEENEGLTKTYRVHHLVFLPHFEAAFLLRKKLEKIGNINSDGRPILKLSSRNLLEIILEIPNAFLIPAHIWTPWYALLGQRSGYESVEQCFKDLSSEIFALETGLSSDVGMNRECKMLNPYAFISNSDAHSGQKLAREVNIFANKPDYNSLFKALHYETREETKNNFIGTVEVYPTYGKYYTSGHRACDFALKEEESLDICPVCKKKLTEGVAQRVHFLADKEEESIYVPFPQKEFHCLPLREILSFVYKCGENSKKIQKFYDEITRERSELEILLTLDLELIKDSKVREFIAKMRANELKIHMGYDGVYGHITA